MPVLIPDLKVEPQTWPDDWLLVRTSHVPDSPDRRVQLTRFQLTQNGQMMGGGIISTNGHTNTITKDGTLATLADLVGLGTGTGTAGGLTGLDLRGHTLYAVSNGAIVTNSQLNARLDAFTRTIQSLQASVRREEAEVTALQRHEATLNTRIDALQRALGDLEKAANLKLVDPLLIAQIAPLVARLQTLAGAETSMSTALKQMQAAQTDMLFDELIRAINLVLADFASLKASGTSHTTEVSNLETAFTTLLGRLTAAASAPPTHAVDPAITGDLAALKAHLDGIDAHELGLEQEIHALEAAMGTMNAVEVRTAISDLQARIASILTADKQRQSSLDVLAQVLRQEQKLYEVVPHTDGSGLADTRITSENHYITKENLRSPTFDHYVKIGFRDGIHIVNGGDRTTLQAGSLHLDSSAGNTRLDHVNAGTRFAQGAGSMLQSNGNLYLDFVHPTATHIDPVSATNTARHTLSVSDVWDFMHKPPEWVLPEHTNTLAPRNDKVSQISWQRAGESYSRMSGYRGSTDHRLQIEVFGDSGSRKGAEIALVAHPSVPTASSRIVLNAHDVTMATNARVGHDLSVVRNISLKGTVTGATNLYTRTESNARYYTKTESNNRYWTHAQADGRYARIHSHPYLTQAAGDVRYDRKGHTHSYLTQAQGDSRYAPRTHTHTTFGASTFNGMLNAAAGIRVQQSSMFTYNMRKTYGFVNTSIPASVGQAIIILSPTDIFNGILTASSGNALPSLHSTVAQAKVTSGKLWLWTPKPVGKSLIVLI